MTNFPAAAMNLPVVDPTALIQVDAEGKAQGIERELADMLGRWQGIPVTYAGGVGSFADLQELKKLGRDHIDVTIGSALDLFGGSMPYREVLRVCAANLDENS